MSFTVQRTTDFFKGERRKIQLVVGFVRGLAAILLLLLYSAVTNVLADQVTDFANVQALFEISFLYIIAIFIGIFTILAALLGTIFVSMNGVGGLQVSGNFTTDLMFAMRGFFEVFLMNGISVTGNVIDVHAFLGSAEDPFAPLSYLLDYQVRTGYEHYVLYGIIYLSLLVAMLTGINFILRGKVSQAGWTLGLSQIVIGLGYMNNLILPLTLNGATISTLLGSTMFQLALLAYLYLEYSLQTGYLNKIAQPTLARQKRVGKQLERLNNFKLGITKIDKDVKQVEKISEEDEDTEGTSTALSVGAGSNTSKKFGANALVFLLDSAQDSLFKGTSGEKEKLTGRLQRYHDGLLRHDRTLDKKLGGAGSDTFNPFMTLLSIFITIIVRITVLVFFAYLTLNASAFFSWIKFSPTLTNSIEFTQPESILLVLIPLIFLMIGGSVLIAKVQDMLVKANEKIISESEIQKLVKKGADAFFKSKEETEKKAKTPKPQPKRKKIRRKAKK